MKSIIKFIKNSYINILESIAFYPVLISLGFFLMAMAGLRLENFKAIQLLKENVPYFFIQDYETARSILSTVIGGILSLTVFSFTMVMVVLNQASSDFSPRLLPGLISNKKHQIILGFYIGTLLYCIIILISLGAYGVDSNSLGLSTMLAALLAVMCIGLFVYFIDSISSAIQIRNIVDRIFSSSEEYLKNELENQRESKVALKEIDAKNWKVIPAKSTGYFRGFDSSLMNSSLRDVDNEIYIMPYMNQHIWKGMPMIKTKNEVSQEEAENLVFCVTISTDRHDGDKGIQGMIKLMEIAVKAMSPGINDPGTAINAIVKLGQLLRYSVRYPHIASEHLDSGRLKIIKNNVNVDELMRILIQPIRLYSKHDNSVLYVLIEALQFLLQGGDITGENKTLIIQELAALKEDVNNNIENKADKTRMLALFEVDKFEVS